MGDGGARLLHASDNVSARRVRPGGVRVTADRTVAAIEDGGAGTRGRVNVRRRRLVHERLAPYGAERGEVVEAQDVKGADVVRDGNTVGVRDVEDVINAVEAHDGTAVECIRDECRGQVF